MHEHCPPSRIARLVTCCLNMVGITFVGILLSAPHANSWSHCIILLKLSIILGKDGVIAWVLTARTVWWRVRQTRGSKTKPRAYSSPYYTITFQSCLVDNWRLWTHQAWEKTETHINSDTHRTVTHWSRPQVTRPLGFNYYHHAHKCDAISSVVVPYFIESRKK